MANVSGNKHGAAPNNLRILLLTLVACICLVDETRCEVYKSLQWTPDNVLFKPNSSGCDDGVLTMNVLPNSKIFVVCPTTVTILDTVQSPKPKHELFENLWIVYDEERFKKCDANATNPKPSQKASRLLMECDNPLELNYYAVVFQEFSAISDGLEFKTGKYYYFLATSDGTQGSLSAYSGGHCNDSAKDVAMKFKVYVCTNGSDPLCPQHELGRLRCEKSSTASTAVTPSPSTAASKSTLNPAASSKTPCATMTHTVLVNKTLCDSVPVKSTVTPSSCACPKVTQVGTKNCTLTTVYSPVTRTVWVNRTAMCDNNQAGVTPSSSTCACHAVTVTPVTSNGFTHTTIDPKLPSSNAYINTSVALANQSVMRDTSMAGRGSVTQSNDASATAYPVTITHTLEIHCTICDGVALSRSTITPTYTHSTTVIPEKNDSGSKLGRQEGSESSKDGDAWKPVAIFFICLCCVVVPLAFVIYKKVFLKRGKRVSPANYETT